MIKGYYYKKSDEELIKFEGKSMFDNYRNGKTLTIYPKDGMLFADHLFSNDGVEIICVLHDNQKLLFNMLVTTDDFVQYRLLSNGAPISLGDGKNDS